MVCDVKARHKACKYRVRVCADVQHLLLISLASWSHACLADLCEVCAAADVARSRVSRSHLTDCVRHLHDDEEMVLKLQNCEVRALTPGLLSQTQQKI